MVFFVTSSVVTSFGFDAQAVMPAIIIKMATQEIIIFFIVVSPFHKLVVKKLNETIKENDLLIGRLDRCVLLNIFAFVFPIFVPGSNHSTRHHLLF